MIAGWLSIFSEGVPKNAWNRIVLTGPDAGDFLNRLSTVSISQLSNDLPQPGYFLNPLGKIISAFQIRQLAPTRYQLEFADLPDGSWRARLLSHLDQFTFSENYEIQTPNSNWCWTFSASDFTSTWQDSPPSAPPGLTEWTWSQFIDWRTQVGLPWIGSEITPDLNPLDIGRAAHIPDQKGCYPGQEVIEKIRALGSPARRLARIRRDDGSLALKVIPKTQAVVGKTVQDSTASPFVVEHLFSNEPPIENPHHD